MTDRKLWLGELVYIGAIDVMEVGGAGRAHFFATGYRAGRAHFFATGYRAGRLHYYESQSDRPPLGRTWRCAECGNTVTAGEVREMAANSKAYPTARRPPRRVKPGLSFHQTSLNHTITVQRHAEGRAFRMP